MARTEVQHHGFSWERDLMRNVYGATDEDIAHIGYTQKVDIPASINKLDHCDVSVKTTGVQNSVCMADCLRVFDSVDSDIPIHLVVITYSQNDLTKVKELKSVIEIDLTSSREMLFGTVTREEIQELDRLVKRVPQKRKPTKEEYDRMYSYKKELQLRSGAIRFDIKCNSTQSRLQCSFNKFQLFLANYPERIIAQSNTNEFRGGVLSKEIVSGRRTFKKKTV